MGNENIAQPSVSSTTFLDNKITWFILAYSFNMDGRAPSQTITDRLPFLLNDGIIPVVLSAPIGVKDNRFPHYQVYSPSPSGFLYEFRHIIGQRIKSFFPQKLLKALLTIVLLPFYILEKLVIHLDSPWSWFISASIKSIVIVHRHKPVVVYSTAGPSSTHLTGFIVSRIFGLPWLAEVHDPLIYDNDKRRLQFYYFKKWLEKIICRHADKIIYFTEKALASAQNRNDNICKGIVLRPGAEPPDITKLSYKKRDKMYIGHFGSLAKNRNLAVVCQAIGMLLREKPENKNKISIDIYGSELDVVSLEAVTRYGLDNVVNQYGRLEYDPQTGKSGRQRVLEAMFISDILLLIHGEDIICDEYIPSKLYEYLLTGRPIIGLAKKNSELDIILRQNGHISLDCNDHATLKQTLDDLIRKWEQDELAEFAGSVKKSPFTVKNATDQIKLIVKELTSTI